MRGGWLLFGRGSVLFSIGLASARLAAGQQDPSLTQGPAAFGLGIQVLDIAAPQFSGKLEPSGNLSYDASHFFYNSASSSPQGFIAQISLPSGAQIVQIDCHVRDLSAANNVFMSYQKGGFNVITNTAAGGFSNSFSTTGTLGGQVLSYTPSAANGAIQHSSGDVRWSYYLVAFIANDTSFRGCRVLWQRTVSPAPAVATFPVDVPTTHPYFRFIEALAAAGITGGCGPQQYCPSNPITRGEMAVFLAAALGLHSPF